MFNILQPYLKRPSLYERTDEKFWSDPHIASQMLPWHLNPDSDAASRKPEFINRSAEWISSLIPAGSRLLDIGCGPGLYAKRFAERGLRVTGMDISANSIAYAREHDPTSTYIEQDYLTMDFENAFDIITLIYCDYAALIPGERKELLNRIYRALLPRGLFVFDVFTSLTNAGREEKTSWAHNPNGGFWSPKPHICMSAVYHYGQSIAVERNVIIEDGNIRCYNIWDCCFTKKSLLDEVSTVGFSNADFYSDVTGMPYAGESQTLCAVLRKSM